MSKGYRELPHTADVYLEVYAPSLNEAFEQAGVALFDVMTDISSVDAKLSTSFKIEAEDLYSLLFEYIRELLFLVDTEECLFKDFNVEIKNDNDKYKLYATVKGEKIDFNKHRLKTEIKAPTYAQMEILTSEKQVVLRFVVDI
ncbi:MAG: archease [Candidatus Odinarchaeum yellowstonii]|uniref:Archease n=1 Tax=Odinarchaeota yellowstonii (strain LCB_4) TaxID=1841599 RepID=A0AAF0D3C0_ODILC|nr:MAG: archease [Candidatus Odinarchaeum yellowstonii]